MKYLIIITLIAVIVYFITTRSTASLQMTEEGVLLLKIDKKDLRLETSLVSEKELTFRTVSVTQVLLKDEDGSLLVFERALTDLEYQFDHRSQAQLIKAIFDARKMIPVYTMNNLTFYQMITKDEAVIDIIVHHSNDQALRFVYGFSDARFKEILTMIDPSDSSFEKKLNGDVSRLETPESAIKSRWSTPLNTIGSLIIPLDSNS